MQKGVEISLELEQQIARNVKMAMRDELKEEVRTSLYRMKPEMEQEISAGASEAICALNWRIAQFTKRYGSFMDDVQRLVDQLECQTIGPETEKPIEEEAPVVEAPLVEAKVKPRKEPEVEKRECVEVVGLCPNCHIGYTQEDKDGGFKHCVECGGEGQSPKIGWLSSPIIGYCRSSETCDLMFEKGDEHHEKCPKCGGTSLVWYLKGETNPVKPSGEEEPLVGHCAHCSVGFSQEDKDDNFVKCPQCGRDITWD